MSKDWIKDIQEFHTEVMLDPFTPKDKPHIPTSKYEELRFNLIDEEVKETLEAIETQDLVKLAEGIADSIVVLLGTALTYGIDLQPIWDEVHHTNMAKKGGLMRPDGKRLKPEGWQPPNIQRLIKEQQSARV